MYCVPLKTKVQRKFLAIEISERPPQFVWLTLYFSYVSVWRESEMLLKSVTLCDNALHLFKVRKHNVLVVKKRKENLCERMTLQVKKFHL